MATGTSVELDGALFEHPKQTIDYHVHVMTKKMADQAALAIKFQGQTAFRYERSKPTGAWRRSIKTRQHRDSTSGQFMSGFEVHDSGIVYGPWLEGVGSRNYPVTRFKGYSTFRRVRDEIERKAPQMLTTQTVKMAKDLER